MAHTLTSMHWRVFACVLILYNLVLCGHTFRSSYIKFLESCSLTEATNHTMLDSADCKYACLAKRESGGCAAYQWDTETRTCRLRETLKVMASSSGDSVGMMMDSDEPEVCSDDTDCPLGHRCYATSSCFVTAMCIAADYAGILAAFPSSQSGVYKILAGTQQAHSVWCDMDTDGGGWTVFLKRLDGSEDFYQNLAAYKQGFGKVSSEYWLGLDVLHALTSSKTYQLRADISDWEGASVYSLYQSMVVTGESNNYRLTLGPFTAGEGRDALSKNDQMEFSTKDADRDVYSGRCARKCYGGFWYERCMSANPTGKYYIGGTYSSSDPQGFDGIQWVTWRAHDTRWYSMKTVEMKLRP